MQTAKLENEKRKHIAGYVYIMKMKYTIPFLKFLWGKRRCDFGLARKLHPMVLQQDLFMKEIFRI